MSNFSICQRAGVAILSAANVSFSARQRVPVSRRGRIARRSSIYVAFVASVGCTEFAAGDDVLSEGESSLLSGPTPVGEDWSCVTPASVVDNDADLVMATQQSVRVMQSLQFLTLGTGIVPANSSLRVCAIADVNCEQPLADGFKLDAEGWVTLPLFQGFNGYIEVRADGVLPTMLYLGKPLQRPRPSDYPVALVQRAILPGVSGATGTMQTDTTGLLVIRVFDCQDVSASGVSFSQQQEGVEWYYVGSLPSSAVDETGSEGLGGFINTPPGTSIISTSGRRGQSLASRKTVSVRADWMTALRMWVGEETDP
jgi:hypothetical protein